MSELMDIKLVIDKGCPKMTVTIKNNERNEDVEGLVSYLQDYSAKKTPLIAANFKGSVVMIPQMQIVRLYVFDRKVMIQTVERLYEVKKPLKELEEILDDNYFVKISQSEIINLKKVKSFDFSTSGTIGVQLFNGESTFVARRRVRDVKELLERGGHNG